MATPSYPKGRLTSVSNGVSTTRYDQTAYTYDLAGNLLAQTYPSGRVVAATHDAAGRVQSVRWDGQYVADSFAYWPHGPVASVRLGNGLWEQSFFNVRLQPWRLGLARSPTTTELWRVDYAQEASGNHRLAYVEAEYFGGDGDQAAIVWERGAVRKGPVATNDAIDQALRDLGIVASSGKDEFDTVGLNRWRSTSQWLEGLAEAT